MRSSGQDWLELIPRLPGWILGVAGVVTTLGGLIKLWLEGPVLVAALLIGVGVAGGALGCTYLAFKRAPSRLEGPGVWAYPRVRPWALAGLWLFAAAAIGGGTYYLHERNRLADEILIVVADFDGERPQTYRVTELILQKLEQALEADRGRVRVQPLHETITAKQGSEAARASGAGKGASIVIWGWYAVTASDVLITAHFELLTKLAFFSPNQPRQSLAFAPAALDGFRVQQQLSGEMSHLALLALGAVHLEARAYDKAVARFTDALNVAAPPKDMVDPGEVYALRATAHFARGALDQALADIDRALQHGGDRVAYHVVRGGIQFLRFDLDSALGDFTLAIEGALKIPDPDAATRSKLAVGYLGRGQIWLAKRDDVRAREDFARAIPLLSDEGASSYAIRGSAYLQTGELDKAIADLSRSIQLDPRDRCACAHLQRAAAYLKQGDARRGFADLAQATRLAPDSPMSYLTRGIFLAERGDHAAAVADLSRAIELGPGFVTAYAVRGVTYRELGDRANALADFDRAIALKPDFADGYFARGQLHRQWQEYDAAIADFTRVVTLDPGNGLAYVERAAAYLERQQTDLALADAEQAIGIRPPGHIGSAYFLRGRARLAKGALEAAIADFSTAIELKPAVGPYAYRARAYKQKGDPQRALSDLRDARRYAPEGSSQRRWIDDEQAEIEAAAK
jgi:tetratricopeptide (TPR) repeat protein